MALKIYENPGNNFGVYAGIAEAGRETGKDGKFLLPIKSKESKMYCYIGANRRDALVKLSAKNRVEGNIFIVSGLHNDERNALALHDFLVFDGVLTDTNIVSESGDNQTIVFGRVCDNIKQGRTVDNVPWVRISMRIRGRTGDIEWWTSAFFGEFADNVIQTVKPGNRIVVIGRKYESKIKGDTNRNMIGQKFFILDSTGKK